MSRSAMPSLGAMFTVIAVVEAVYAVSALLTPPHLVIHLVGWNLSPDGQWSVKLLGAALGFQAWVAWMFRKQPHRGIAGALAAYQLVAATIDWVMWLALADQGIFSTPLSRVTVVVSIMLHYGLGLMLLLAMRQHRPEG